MGPPPPPPPPPKLGYLDTYKIEVIRACALVHVYVRVCGGFLRMRACVSVRTRRMRVGAYPGMRTGVRVHVHTLT